MRPWLEISAAALTANARAIGRLTAPAQLCAVVKSNAYGHGLVPASQAIAAAGVPGLGFGVFRAAEGLAMRAAGISEPILVLGPVDEPDVAELVAAEIELGLTDEGDVESYGRRHATVHLKVETGTSRFGVAPLRALIAADRLRELGATVVGIYSHLADSEELDASFAREQLARLMESSNIVGGRPIRHIAASAAALMWPEFRLEMVRCGIAMYGAWPSESVRERMAEITPTFALQPALRFFAPIVHMMDVASGDTVGYGCEYRTARESRIAVLPVGYADGLPRAAGQESFSVMLGALRAPIVGRICMNACMIDVTECKPQPVRGDVAEFDIDELAKAADTINYEVLARLSPELERRYD
ncbi:MAG TPA: alanine racemase [Candidatus Eremiobacteraceae bacterium]